jgi:hypothetical protein
MCNLMICNKQFEFEFEFEFKFVNPSLFTLVKLSLDVYEKPHVQTLLILSRFIFHVY